MKSKFEVEYEKGDRVQIGSPQGPMIGTVVKVSSDGEIKIKLDGVDDEGMYYPPSAVEQVVMFEPL